MNRIKLYVCAFVAMALCLTIEIAKAAGSKAALTSTCFLRNPPESSVDWKFYGNQKVWVSLENGNVLGVAATLGEFHTNWQYEHYIIAPFNKTPEQTYSKFSDTPVVWRFSISTASDAALTTGHARWNPF